MTKQIAMTAGILALACLTGYAAPPDASESAEVQEMKNLRQAALACHMFAMDHKNVLPSTTAEIAPYLKEGFDLSQVELVAGGELAKIKKPSATALLRSKTVSKAGKRAVAFVDGHCELVAE